MGYGGDLPQQKAKTMNLLTIPTIKELRDNQKRIDGVSKIVKIKKKRKERKTIRSYKTYMTSSLWKKRKNQYWQKYKKICEACGSKNFVTLHHKIYTDSFGDEPDEDVVALCGRCHNEFHKHYGCKKDMRKETDEFVLEMWSMKQGLYELYEQDKR